jgi:hypothetical protein
MNDISRKAILKLLETIKEVLKLSKRRILAKDRQELSDLP